MIFSVIIKAHAGMRPKAQKETVEQMKDHTANSTQSYQFLFISLVRFVRIILDFL